MMSRTLSILFLSVLVTPVLAQDAPASVEEMMKVFAENKITFDAEAQTITLETVVCQPDQPLEYLLIHPRGKTHEALLIAETKSSVLNAALLALGYEPGTNAAFLDKNPPPTMEEVQAGVPLYEMRHPEGMEMWFTVRFTDADGEEQHLVLEELLIDRTSGEPVQDNSWIFLGGKMGSINRGDPEVFLGDYTGNLISICYLAPEVHLATMRHQRAPDDQNWWVDGERMPKPGSPVQLVIHRNKPDLVAAREERLGADKGKDEKR